MLNDIPVFVALVEAGSFVQAAKNLRMTQATVSRRLQALEEVLGFSLIKRSTRSFEITPMGESLYDGVKSQQSHLEQLIQRLQHKANGIQGKLKVALPSVISYDIITPFIPEFLQKYPGITLEIDYHTREIDLLRDGIDLAIVNYRPKQQTLKMRILYKIKFKLYCTPEYVEKYGMPKTLEEMPNHLVTGMIRSDSSIDRIIYACHKNGQETPFQNKARLLYNNGLHGRRFALTGHVVGAGWDMLYQKELAEGTILPVLPDYHFGELVFYLIRLENQDNQLINLFIDFLEECFIKAKITRES